MAFPMHSGAGGGRMMTYGTGQSIFICSCKNIIFPRGHNILVKDEIDVDVRLLLSMSIWDLSYL